MDRLNCSPTFTCNGLQAGKSFIPSFEVGPGEIIKIVFPSARSFDMHLAEQRICEEANRVCRAATVELAHQSAWWREIFHRQTTAEWLIAQCRISPSDAVERLNGVRVDPRALLCQMGANPRWMLGFLAAMHGSPNVLVFTTSGCDPLGVRNALKTVTSQLRDKTAVYLSCFPDLRIDEPQYASILEAQSCEPITVGQATEI